MVTPDTYSGPFRTTTRFVVRTWLRPAAVSTPVSRLGLPTTRSGRLLQWL